MTVCTACAGDVPAGASTCPECGHGQGPAHAPGGGGREKLAGLGCGLLGALLALLALVLAFGLLAGGLLG
jgi:hypothetical protein